MTTKYCFCRQTIKAGPVYGYARAFATSQINRKSIRPRLEVRRPKATASSGNGGRHQSHHVLVNWSERSPERRTVSSPIWQVCRGLELITLAKFDVHSEPKGFYADGQCDEILVKGIKLLDLLFSQNTIPDSHVIVCARHGGRRTRWPQRISS